MSYAIGIDMGGTFVDAILMDKKGGEVRIQKSPSTPGDPTEGITNALCALAGEMNISVSTLLGRTDEIIHGTTAIDNALINRRLPKTGLITTKGFGWTLPLMRSGRVFIEDQQLSHKPAAREETAWIPSYLIAEVSERVDFQGVELASLDMDDVAAGVKSLVNQGVEAIAICLLWSFKNPQHEQAIESYIREIYPHIFVSTSSTVMPVMREFERSVTTILNCFVGKVLGTYLDALVGSLREQGYQNSLYVMQSSGGAMVTGNGNNQPFVYAWNSGPTGGVMGAKFLGDNLGYRHILSLDMGGTSTDVSMIIDGARQVLTRPKVHGYTAHLPVLDIVSIGAGGGSIAWVDYGPLLKVGPNSAGADPGPACYAKGGSSPTVTDADVVLGYIDPDYFLAGRIRLDKQLATNAIDGLARQLDMDLVQAAAGINKVCNSNMINAMRAVSVERGFDPRNVLMMSFGGAGPTHGAFLMDALGIKQNLVPFTETVHSAFGFLTADVTYNFSLTDVMLFPADLQRLNGNYAQLEAQGRRALETAGIPGEMMAFNRYAELRYRGQVWEVAIPIQNGELTEESMPRILATFDNAYETLYGKGSAWKQSGVEFVNFRVEALGRFERPKLTPSSSSEPGRSSVDIVKSKRQAYFEDAARFLATDVFDGTRIETGMKFYGPAIIEKMGTTVVIPPGKMATVDGYRNILIEKEG